MHPQQSRIDIQLLRAIAVLFVLLFHAKLPGLAGGFLGVDIFLVISGYLITGLIARRIDEGRFSISGFYLNRAKRLLPASYTVYLVTGVLGLWLLTDSEFQRYLETLFGALTFSANVLLWQGTDYFGASAKFNVLLHVWSLSLEEQFYFILPFAMVVVPRRFWFPMLLGGFALSFLLCFILVTLKPVATFYLLPTRAWELLIGSMLALQENRLKALLPVWAPRAGLVALGLLVILPIFMPFEALGFIHPGLDAFIVTIATAVVILVRPQVLNRWNPVTRAGFGLGNISYSLYLVHWPLFAFAENVYFGEGAPLYLRLVLLLFSVVLALALHVGIERPIHLLRIDAIRWRMAGSFFAATLTVWFIASMLPQLRNSPRDYAAVMQPNYGLSQRCGFSGVVHEDAACRTGDAPNTILWGDSFAMHVVRALPESANPFQQATMSGCAPVVGIAQINHDVGHGPAWAKSCIRFNDAVYAYIDTNPEIDTVILSSLFDQVLATRSDGAARENGELVFGPLSFETGTSHYLNTIDNLVQKGLKVIIIGPTPTIGADLADCVERREMGLLVLGHHSDCTISREKAYRYRASAFRMIERLRQIDGVHVIDLFDILCDDTSCRPTRGDVILFRDAGHLSVAGSEFLGETDALGIGPALIRFSQ